MSLAWADKTTPTAKAEAMKDFFTGFSVTDRSGCATQNGVKVNLMTQLVTLKIRWFK
jgi:hypothetical protein